MNEDRNFIAEGNRFRELYYGEITIPKPTHAEIGWFVGLRYRASQPNADMNLRKEYEIERRRFRDEFHMFPDEVNQLWVIIRDHPERWEKAKP